MASALAANAGVHRADFGRLGFRLAFHRLPAVEEPEPEWWYEPEIAGVYRLMSVNGRRPPFFWRLPSCAPGRFPEWLISGRAFLRDDRSYVLRLASGQGVTPAGETTVTLLQGSWAPAMTGQLAVRNSEGEAGAWLANGRSLMMKALLLPPGEEDVVELTLRFSRWQ